MFRRGVGDVGDAVAEGAVAEVIAGRRIAEAGPAGLIADVLIVARACTVRCLLSPNKCGAAVFLETRRIGIGDAGMSLIQPVFSLLARLFLATLFLVEGYGKIASYREVVAYMASHNVPGGLLPVVILTEVAGGLLIALGFLTRAISFAMAGFALLTALFFHTNFDDPEQLVHILKNIAIAGGFFSLVASGAGAWSLDAFLFRRDWGRTAAQKAGHPSPTSSRPART